MVEVSHAGTEKMQTPQRKGPAGFPGAFLVRDNIINHCANLQLSGQFFTWTLTVELCCCKCAKSSYALSCCSKSFLEKTCFNSCVCFSEAVSEKATLLCVSVSLPALMLNLDLSRSDHLHVVVVILGGWGSPAEKQGNT